MNKHTSFAMTVRKEEKLQILFGPGCSGFEHGVNGGWDKAVLSEVQTCMELSFPVSGLVVKQE